MLPGFAAVWSSRLPRREVCDQVAVSEAIGEQGPQVRGAVGEGAMSDDLHDSPGQEIADASLLIQWRQIHRQLF